MKLCHHQNWIDVNSDQQKNPSISTLWNKNFQNFSHLGKNLFWMIMHSPLLDVSENLIVGRLQVEIFSSSAWRIKYHNLLNYSSHIHSTWCKKVNLAFSKVNVCSRKFLEALTESQISNFPLLMNHFWLKGIFLKDMTISFTDPVISLT